MNELEMQIYNRLKFGIPKTEIRKELGVSTKKIHKVYIKYGFDQIDTKSIKGKFPPDPINEWDLLHAKYGEIHKRLLEEWDRVAGRIRACQR